MLNDERLMELVLRVKELTDPECIYLFGSYANQTQSDNSDIDLAVIKNGITNKRKFILDIEKEIISPDYSVDLLVFSENEFNTKLSEGWKLFKEINQKGKLFYAKR